MKPIANTTGEPAAKTTKYSLQTVTSAGTPLQQQQLGAATNSLPPNTIIKATTQTQYTAPMKLQPFYPIPHYKSDVRQYMYIKLEFANRTMRKITLEMIDNNPVTHLGHKLLVYLCLKMSFVTEPI